MTAWEHLKAASSLNSGNAWDLLTHPREGVVMNDGITVDLAMSPIEVELVTGPIVVEVEPG